MIDLLHDRFVRHLFMPGAIVSGIALVSEYKTKDGLAEKAIDMVNA